MDKKSLRIFIACALGAGIGALIALELNSYLWWIGVLVGAFVGYLSYEFKKVIAAVPVVMAEAKKACQIEVPVRAMMGGIKAGLNYFIAVVMGSIFLIFYAIEIGAYFILSENKFIAQDLTNIISASVALAFLVAILFSVVEGAEKVHGYSATFSAKDFWKCFRYTSPLGVIFFTGKFMIWALPRIGIGLKFLKVFAKKFLIIIHSDIRLLCAVDAAIGASIGYFSGSAIIGAVVGGVLGVINYEIISIKVLKLNPSN